MLHDLTFLKQWQLESHLVQVNLGSEEHSRLLLASTLKKRFAVRSDLIGKVTEVDGSNYSFRFIKDTKPR